MQRRRSVVACGDGPRKRAKLTHLLQLVAAYADHVHEIDEREIGAPTCHTSTRQDN